VKRSRAGEDGGEWGEESAWAAGKLTAASVGVGAAGDGPDLSIGGRSRADSNWGRRQSGQGTTGQGGIGCGAAMGAGPAGEDLGVAAALLGLPEGGEQREGREEVMMT